ncbi:MAG: PaaI family thioesterase [Neisseriaceae bacterium]|nr:PaaI family thioesterase [Neisseriaceae bacterium]
MKVVNPKVHETLRDHYMILPHCQALGLKYEGIEADEAIVLSLPWQAAFNGPDGAMHGGPLATLVDVACAIAVTAWLPQFEALATLDMRLDFLRPVQPNKPVFAKAVCEPVTGMIAYVKAECYQEGEAEPVVLCTAAFIRSPLPRAILEALV